MSVDAATVTEILVSSGVFTTMASAGQWFFTRGRGKVDNAKVVQGMAIELLTPLRQEVDRTREEASLARKEAEQARKDCSKVRREFEVVLGWALALREILDERGIKHPPVPPIVKDRVE